MAEEWELDEVEMDAWLEEWEAVDRAAADYLADHVPGVTDDVTADDAAWLEALAETIFPDEDPSNADIDSVSAVMALQHADWLGLAMGATHRGPGSSLDASVLMDDVNGLVDVEGEIDDPEGFREVASVALLHLISQWQDLGVLDQAGQLTSRGVWGLPRAMYRAWRDDD